MKLSRPQKIALDKLTAEWECSYTMGVSRKTLDALVKKGLAEGFGDMNNTDQTLEDRGTRYGDFAGHALVTQSIKRAMSESENWQSLSDDKREALEMIAHKIGRILNGDPDYQDSWHNIIGYARLVERQLQGDGV